MSFSGFSEEDIRKLKTSNNANVSNKPAFDKVLVNVNKQMPPKKVTFKLTSSARINDLRAKKLHNNNLTTTQPTQLLLPENAKLSSTNRAVNAPTNPKLEPSLIATTTDNDDNVATKAQISAVDDDDNRLSEQQQHPNLTASANNDPNNVVVVVNETKTMDLEQFEIKQKRMEEQNRRRKELLSKALADRTKRTQDEALRLNAIQTEFKKLDEILSNDVKILRKQIELASIDYSDCQKRYNRIEKEFLEAKLVLHQKLEKKELLTEHLCAIIEKNEERKAEKLTALLEKLELDPKIFDVCENVNNSESGAEGESPKTPNAI